MFENDNSNTGMENFQSDGFETTVSGVENVTKKAKGRKAALIGGISAAVIAGGSVTAYAASDTVKNQIKLRVSSPEKYYSWVTEKNSDDLGRKIGEYYRKQLDNYEKGMSANVKLTFEPTDDAKALIIDELLYDDTDDETKQFKSIINDNSSYSVAADYKLKKGKVNSNIGFELSNKKVLGFDFAADTKNMEYFMRIPELKEQWIGLEYSGDDRMYGLSGAIKTYKAILDDPASLISPDELEEEINRYAGVWSSFADDVEIEKKESVDICDISVNYTVATVELTDKDLDKLALEYLKEMKGDKILKNIVVNKLKMVDDEEEYTEELDKEIENLREDIKDNDYDNETVVTIDTYIDATGTIRGFGVGNDDGAFTAIIGKDGSDVRGEVKYVEDKNEEWFSVRLKAEESGKSYTGDLTFTYKDYDYHIDDYKDNTVAVKFSDVELKDNEKGYFNGDISIEIPDVDPINISFRSDGKSEDISYEAVIEGTDYGKIKLSYSMEYGAKVDIPDKGDSYMVDIEDAYDFELEDYVARDDFSAFISKTLTDIGFEEDTAEELADDIAAKAYNEIDNDFDWDDDDFDFDFDYDDDDEPSTSTAGDSIIGSADSPSGLFVGGSDDDDMDFDVEFDPSQFKYDDFKDFMTEEQYKEFMDEMQKAAETYSSSGRKAS